MKKVVIVGGGISGLACARRLAEIARERSQSFQITVLEAAGRLGGVIQTRRPDPGGFLLEEGPDSFISDKPWGLELARRLGLENELIGTAEDARRSFVLYRGRLCEVPAGFYLTVPMDARALLNLRNLSWAGKIRVALECLIPEPRCQADESVGEFLRRRVGREVVDRIAQPMIGGIYTAEIDRLSLLATFPQFKEMALRHGSLIRAMRKKKSSRAAASASASGPRYSLFLSPRQGMSSLIRRLAESLPEVAFKTGAAVTRLEKSGPAAWKISHAGGTLEADAVCLAVPAPRAADLLRAPAAGVAAELSGIAYESVVTVNIAYARRQWERPLKASGFVVPAVEQRPFVGCTFSSLKFPGRAPEGALLLRVFAGGALHPGLIGWTDEEIRERMTRELSGILGMSGAPLFAEVHRHPQSMPQYRVGHLDLVARVEAAARRERGLFLTGNAYRGIGIPDCVRQAEAAAEAIAENFSHER